MYGGVGGEDLFDEGCAGAGHADDEDGGGVVVGGLGEGAHAVAGEVGDEGVEGVLMGAAVVGDGHFLIAELGLGEGFVVAAEGVEEVGGGEVEAGLIDGSP